MFPVFGEKGLVISEQQNFAKNEMLGENCQQFYINFSSSFDFRNEPNEADESSPMSTEDVEKGIQTQAILSFGDRCSLAFGKSKIYSIYWAKVCLVTLTSLILLLWDSLSDYLVSIKHFK